MPGKAEFGRYCDWQVRRITALGIEIRLGTGFDAETAAGIRPGVPVMATGAVVEGELLHGLPAVPPDRAIDRPWESGGHVLGFDSDQEHLEAALTLPVLGRHVDVIAAGPLGPGMGATAKHTFSIPLLQSV